MSETTIDGLSVFAGGVYPVELSAGKRINAAHRVEVRASVDVFTGEVRFYVDTDAVETLKRDSE